MANHKIGIQDTAGSGDAIGNGETGAAPERKEYTVVAENGVFKRGKVYKQGEKVELDERTAKAALEAGDVEE